MTALLIDGEVVARGEVEFDPLERPEHFGWLIDPPRGTITLNMGCVANTLTEQHEALMRIYQCVAMRPITLRHHGWEIGGFLVTSMSWDVYPPEPAIAAPGHLVGRLRIVCAPWQNFRVPDPLLTCHKEDMTVDALRELLGPSPGEDGGVRFTSEGGFILRPSDN